MQQKSIQTQQFFTTAFGSIFIASDVSKGRRAMEAADMASYDTKFFQSIFSMKEKRKLFSSKRLKNLSALVAAHGAVKLQLNLFFSSFFFLYLHFLQFYPIHCTCVQLSHFFLFFHYFEGFATDIWYFFTYIFWYDELGITSSKILHLIYFLATVDFLF